MEEERVKKEIALTIVKNGLRYEWAVGCADQILAIKGIRIEAENQDLPNPDTEMRVWETYSPDLAHHTAQQDMLKTGFVKCLKKEEKRE